MKENIQKMDFFSYTFNSGGATKHVVVGNNVSEAEERFWVVISSLIPQFKDANCNFPKIRKIYTSDSQNQWFDYYWLTGGATTIGAQKIFDQNPL